MKLQWNDSERRPNQVLEKSDNALVVLIIPVSRGINEVDFIESLMIAYESKTNIFKEMRYF